MVVSSNDMEDTMTLKMLLMLLLMASMAIVVVCLALIVNRSLKMMMYRGRTSW